MPKLAKQMYSTKEGRKINCYVCNIPKEIVDKTDIADNEIRVYSIFNKIIIEKKTYYYVCMGCGYEWESDREEKGCPKCKVGDIYLEDNNDNKK